MTKKLGMFLALCLGWVVALRADDAAAPKTHPNSTGWQNLFAADLSNATYPKGVWSFENGVLTATKDENIWTNKSYGDCIIDLEFQNSPGANSGIFVYGQGDLKSWANSVEIQILDDGAPKWAKVANTWRCGAIFGRLAPVKSAVKKPGQWNRMTITCKGPKISVLLNGAMVTQFDMKKWTSAKKNPDGSEIPSWLVDKPLAEYTPQGRIGLQGKHGEAPIYFRNIKIKPL